LVRSDRCRRFRHRAQCLSESYDVEHAAPGLGRDGKIEADGAKNVLEVLSQFSPSVKGKKDQIDLSKTYTTEFVTNAAQ
jgi:hypothetical protein